MGSAEKELLFCDTFVHEGNEVTLYHKAIALCIAY